MDITLFEEKSLKVTQLVLATIQSNNGGDN